MTHELRNTHEAKDDAPPKPRDQFLHPRAVADLIEHTLGDLRRARDLVQYVPYNRELAGHVAGLEEMIMKLRRERHY